MKCKECGAEVNPEEKFCGSCGAPVETAEEPIETISTEQAFPPQQTLILRPPSLDPLEEESLPPPPALEELAPSEPVAEFEPPPPVTPPPPPTTAAGSKKKTGLIVAIVVIVLLLLCCCCIAAIAGFLTSEPGQELLWELGILAILPLL